MTPPPSKRAGRRGGADLTREDDLVPIVSMSFVRALAARVFRNKRKDREELDIWRLYHFISYRKQISEGAKQASDLKYPNQRASYKKQYSMVHSAVTQQVHNIIII